MMKKSGIRVVILTITVAIIALVIYRNFFSNTKELRFADIILSPDMNVNLASGKTLELVFNEKKLSDYDSIVVSVGNNVVDRLVQKFTTTVNTENLPLGYQKAEVSVFKKNKKKTVDLPFVIFSDIVPTNSPYIKLKELIHDPKTYTQGLEVYNGHLYESAGQYGESSIRKTELNTGKVLQKKVLAKEYFAEGITTLNGKIYQLTWKEGICIIYDDQLNELKRRNFTTTTGEGWGLCNDGNSLIVSDGSNKLTYINPENFNVEKVISVYAGNTEVNGLNELEYVDGSIYANIYTTNQIVKIQSQTGKVLVILDMTALKNENQSGEVLNGIAYKSSTNTFLVTGKYWNKMYEISFEK